MQNRSSPSTTLEVTSPVAAPYWALLERQLIDVLPIAIKEFHSRYFDQRGFLQCYPRWGALDGPDDAIENITGWTELYALGGGSKELLSLYRHGLEGHLQQYTEAHTVDCPLARDGMYYKEFPTSFDSVHNAEGFHGLFQQGLAEPWNTTYQKRMRRYAGFYMGEDQGAPNYDPEHRLIRSVMTGSRGPVLRKTTPIDWGGDPFECEGRFKPLRWHRTWNDYVEHFKSYQDVTGDTPCNLIVTVMALNAYLFSGEKKYRNWILEYVDAWVERTRENEGIIPSNIGLDGTIGGGCDGRWWGGVYGWDHKAFFRGLAPYGFGNALLVSGDQRYVNAWRSTIRAVNAQSKEIDGILQYPQRYGNNGWYDYSPEPFDHGALEIFYWSMDDQDQPLARRNPWASYLLGDDPDYPTRALQMELRSTQEKIERMRNDLTTPDTRLSETPNDMNPGANIWRLIELMLGGLPSRHIGAAWHTRLRYFDIDRGRAGIPADVASLVESMSDDEVTVTLVNVSPVNQHALVIQAGAYAEHQFNSVEIDGSVTPLDESAVSVQLAPGAGARLSFKMSRYINQPTHAYPGIE